MCLPPGPGPALTRPEHRPGSAKLLKPGPIKNLIYIFKSNFIDKKPKKFWNPS